jgi:hypothetical protein
MYSLASVYPAWLRLEPAVRSAPEVFAAVPAATVKAAASATVWVGAELDTCHVALATTPATYAVRVSDIVDVAGLLVNLITGEIVGVDAVVESVVNVIV